MPQTERRSETSKTNPTARMEMMMMMIMMMMMMTMVMPERPGREEQDPCKCGNAAHEVGLCLAVKTVERRVIIVINHHDHHYCGKNNTADGSVSGGSVLSS